MTNHMHAYYEGCIVWIDIGTENVDIPWHSINVSLQRFVLRVINLNWTSTHIMYLYGEEKQMKDSEQQFFFSHA